jgi:hypothetical protein
VQVAGLGGGADRTVDKTLVATERFGAVTPIALRSSSRLPPTEGGPEDRVAEKRALGTRLPVEARGQVLAQGIAAQAAETQNRPRGPAGQLFGQRSIEARYDGRHAESVASVMAEAGVVVACQGCRTVR